MTGLCGCAASIRAEVWLGAQSESPLSRVDAGRRVVRLLQRRGVLEQGNVDPLWEQEPLLATITAASVQGQIAIGERAGQRVRRRLADPEEGIRTGPLCFASRGFSLHAAPRVEATDRERLERLCRYAMRPPLAAGRLQM